MVHDVCPSVCTPCPAQPPQASLRQLTPSSSIADVALAIHSFMGQGDTLYHSTPHDTHHADASLPHSNPHNGGSSSHAAAPAGPHPSHLLDPISHHSDAGVTGPNCSSQSTLLMDATAAADALAEGVTETAGASPFLLLVEAADLDEIQDAGGGSGSRILASVSSPPSGGGGGRGLPVIFPFRGGGSMGLGAGHARRGGGGRDSTPTSSAPCMPRHGGEGSAAAQEQSSRDHGVS